MKKLFLILLFLPTLLTAKLTVEQFKAANVQLPKPPCDNYKKFIPLFSKKSSTKRPVPWLNTEEQSHMINDFNILFDKFIKNNSTYDDIKKLISIVGIALSINNCPPYVCSTPWYNTGGSLKIKVEGALKTNNITYEDILNAKTEMEKILKLNQPKDLSVFSSVFSKEQALLIDEKIIKDLSLPTSRNPSEADYIKSFDATVEYVKALLDKFIKNSATYDDIEKLLYMVELSFKPRIICIKSDFTERTDFSRHIKQLLADKNITLDDIVKVYRRKNSEYLKKILKDCIRIKSW